MDTVPRVGAPSTAVRLGPSLPPPPQADRINEKTSAEIAPRCFLMLRLDNQPALAATDECITPPMKLHGYLIVLSSLYLPNSKTD
jgi:hypothetical protein